MISLQVKKINFKLEEPISISFHTFHYRENVLVILRHKDLVGYGEAAPFKSITGDSQEEVIEQSNFIKELPLNPEKNSVEDLHKYLDKKIKSQTLRCAVDFAYHDLLGKLKKIPTYNLYARKPKLTENSITIFIKESPKETTIEAKRIFDKYPYLKLLKIKLKGEGDIERVKAIKKVAPARLKFIVDANQGFNDPKNAVKTLTEIKKVLGDVVLVEEPCPKKQLDKLKFVKDNLKSMLVFADESAATIDDVRKIIKKQAADGVNIKLQKAGGIFPSKKIAKMCEENNLKVMVGCMLEGPLAISAGVHFAVSTPNVILTDLDIDLEMPVHAKGIAEFKNGVRIPNKKAGLGVDLNFEKIRNLSRKGQVLFKEYD